LIAISVQHKKTVFFVDPGDSLGCTIIV